MQTRLAVAIVLGSGVLAGCDCGGNAMMTGMDGGVHLDGTAPMMDGQVTPPMDGTAIGWDGTLPGQAATCQGHLYQCGNTLDDDHDGLADAADPDCLGPCDNNEGGFFLNIPGGDHPTCNLDCYFDQDQGSGNDTCQWDHRCDPEFEVESGRCAGPSGGNIPPDAQCPDPQASTCADICAPLVPNGCDCFGCCNLPNGETEDAPGGGTRLVYRFIGSLDGTGTPTCSLAALEAATDTAGRDAACHRCTPVANCNNECGHCELCLGRTELPPDCFMTPDAGPVPDGGTPIDSGTPVIDVCSDPMRQDCGVPGLPACPMGYFCITGCCTYFG